MCGGEEYIVAYEIGEKVVGPPPPSQDDVEGADSIGCFHVNANRGSFAEGVYTLPYMTNKVNTLRSNQLFLRTSCR